MASKGQKFKSYIDEFRIKVMNEYLSGNFSSSMLSNKYNIPVKAIKTWIYKYNHKNYDLVSKRKLNGRRKEENIDYKEKYKILKKPSLPKGTMREKVTFINLYINKYKLSNMCAVLEISRRTYYKYRNGDDPDYLDYTMIKKVFKDSKGTYRYRRITEGLKIEYSVLFNHKKVARIMHKYNIKLEYIRRIRSNFSYRRIEQNVRPNLLKRNFKTDSLNKILDTDITYLIFKGKRLYLSTIIDLYNRHVVSYKISKSNNNQLVIDALNDAIDVHGLIIHSHQGFQYTSYEYKAIFESNGITISMARKGSPIDDAPIES